MRVYNEGILLGVRSGQLLAALLQLIFPFHSRFVFQVFTMDPDSVIADDVVEDHSSMEGTNNVLVCDLQADDQNLEGLKTCLLSNQYSYELAFIMEKFIRHSLKDKQTIL